MARITVEDCIDKFSSRFELVLVASQRAKQLHSGEQPTVEKQNDKNSVIALREIAETTIPISELKENVIKGYQKISIIEEEEIENKEYTDGKYIETTNQISSENDIHQQVDDEIKDLSSKEDQVNEKEISEGENIIPDALKEDSTSIDS